MPRRMRSILALFLVVLTTIAVGIASVGLWVRYVATDTDSFMQIVEPPLSSDEFSNVLSARVQAATVEALDLETRIRLRLVAFDRALRRQIVEGLDLEPEVVDRIDNLDLPGFADLAAPIAEGLNGRITAVVDRVVQSDPFNMILVASVEKGHEAIVSLVSGEALDSGVVYVEDGDVIWNAIPMVAAALERVIEEGLLEGEDLVIPDFSDYPRVDEALSRLGEALEAELPDDLGQISVMEADQLLLLQDYARTFNRLVWVMVAVALVLLVAALVVSIDRRRTAVQLGLASLIAMLLSVLTIRRGVETVQASISDPDAIEAFRSVITAVGDSLRTVWLTVAVLAVVATVVAYLAGRPPWISKLKSLSEADEYSDASTVDRFVSRWSDGLTLAIIALALLVLWVVGMSVVSIVVVSLAAVALVWAVQASQRRVAATNGADPKF